MLSPPKGGPHLKRPKRAGESGVQCDIITLKWGTGSGFEEGVQMFSSVWVRELIAPIKTALCQRKVSHRSSASCVASDLSSRNGSCSGSQRTIYQKRRGA